MLAVLQNHTYQLDKEARLQSDGGPIGDARLDSVTISLFVYFHLI